MEAYASERCHHVLLAIRFPHSEPARPCRTSGERKLNDEVLAKKTRAADSSPVSRDLNSAASIESFMALERSLLCYKCKNENYVTGA